VAACGQQVGHSRPGCPEISEGTWPVRTKAAKCAGTVALPAADRRIREKDVSHVQKEAAKDSQTSFISQPDDGAMDTRAIDSDFRPRVPRPSGKKRKGDSFSNRSTNRRKTTSGNGQVIGASRPTPFTQEEPAPLSQQGFRHSAPRPTPFVQEEPVRPTPFPQDLPPVTAARESSGSGRGPSSLRPATEPSELAREPSAFPSTRGGSQVPQDDFDWAGTVEPNVVHYTRSVGRPRTFHHLPAMFVERHEPPSVAPRH
jgi:hypothetical protein